MSDSFPLGKTFYVMRHFETDDNLKKRTSGRLREPELTERGVLQGIDAGNIIEKLEKPITSIITSEMKRTKESARIACDRDSLRHIPHSVDAGINERAYGVMDGFSEKIRSEFKKIGGVVDGEESKDNLRKRVVATVKKNIGTGETPLFVTHGGCVLRLFAEALGGEKAVDEIKKIVRSRNGAVYEFITPTEEGGKWQVNLLTLDKNKEIERSQVIIKKGKLGSFIKDSQQVGNSRG